MFHERRIMAYSTLTANDVRRIRTLYAEGGILQKEIARLFGISRESVGLIVNGDVGRTSTKHAFTRSSEKHNIRGVSRHP